MTFDRKRVAADEQRPEPVVDGGFDDWCGVEGFPETDDPIVGVDLYPQVVGLFGDADSFDLGDFHEVTAFGAQCIRSRVYMDYALGAVVTVFVEISLTVADACKSSQAKLAGKSQCGGTCYQPKTTASQRLS